MIANRIRKKAIPKMVRRTTAETVVEVAELPALS